MNPHILHYKVLCASIISESEVSITVLCLLCSTRYTAVQIKNCSKSTSVIKVATMKNTMMLRPQLLSGTEVSIALLCQLCLDRYTAVQINNCLKSTSVLKVAPMKSTDDFSLNKQRHHVQSPN